MEFVQRHPLAFIGAASALYYFIQPEPETKDKRAPAMLKKAKAPGQLPKIKVDADDAEDVKEIMAIIERARKAQRIAETYSQEKVDHLIKGMVWACAKPNVAEELSRDAVEESKLGNFEGKMAKLAGKTRAALFDILYDKSVGVVEEDEVNCITKIAKPVGVIGALSPSTNPEATPVIKAINAVKGRNAIIISPHPYAKRVNAKIVAHMRAALVKLGAPADLVIALENPSIPKVNILMKNVDLVLATGGPAMVKAAYSSGTPALGVGAGNAVITVDETADIKDAAKKIRISKTLDLAASCSADNSVIVVEKVYDELLNALIAEGGYLANKSDYEKIAAVLWKTNPNGSKCLNGQLVVRTPQVICKAAGVEISDDVKFIIMPEDGVGPSHPYSGEKLSPIMAFYRVENVDRAIQLTNEIQEYQGKGHSCGIYSTSDENILKLGLRTKTSRVMVNQPQAASNSGNLWNGMPQSFSLGCGSWGNNSTNENINWKHLVNFTWVSKPLPVPKKLPTDEELFGKDIVDSI